MMRVGDIHRLIGLTDQEAQRLWKEKGFFLFIGLRFVPGKGIHHSALEGIKPGKNEKEVEIPKYFSISGMTSDQGTVLEIRMAITPRVKGTYPVLISLSLRRCSIATTHPTWSALA
jgi:hypothetical protein